MTRDDQLAALNKSILRDLPDILDAWLGDARPGLEKLTRAACDDTLTDDEFRRRWPTTWHPASCSKACILPPWRKPMEHAMGTAAVIGKTSVPRV